MSRNSKRTKRWSVQINSFSEDREIFIYMYLHNIQKYWYFVNDIYLICFYQLLQSYAITYTLFRIRYQLSVKLCFSQIPLKYISIHFISEILRMVSCYIILFETFLMDFELLFECYYNMFLIWGCQYNFLPHWLNINFYSQCTMIWRFYENTDLIVFHGIDQCVGNIQHSHMDEIYIKKRTKGTCQLWWS